MVPGMVKPAEAASGKQDEVLIAQRSKCFEQFDIVTDYSDHYFAEPRDRSTAGDSTMSSHYFTEFRYSSAGDRINIMREWRILQQNLPESIYVRVYEQRIDLMRTVIIGPEGTPYHDGLFFFDIVFTADYPRDPPLVYHHSHGLRLNPNLYKDGYVCLSLLNTWDGEKEEVWNASSSTILQLLVSLQALVLNENPYYNEPRGAVSRDLHKRSDSDVYNNQVFLMSCRLMVHTMRKPPLHFEELVEAHFRERARFILRACAAYMDGTAKVGQYKEHGGQSYDSSDLRGIWKLEFLDFKYQMAELSGMLVDEFLENACAGEGGHSGISDEIENLLRLSGYSESGEWSWYSQLTIEYLRAYKETFWCALRYIFNVVRATWFRRRVDKNNFW